MFAEYSLLKNTVLNYTPPLPSIFSNLPNLACEIDPSPVTFSANDSNLVTLKNRFPITSQFPYVKLISSSLRCSCPLKVGVFFSGGPSPGGHNVIAGILSAIKILSKESRLFGFLNGAEGLITNDYIQLTEELVSRYKNLGGFNIIGSGRKKIDIDTQGDIILHNIQQLKLNALVVIGGDGSNTNTVILAEHFLQKNIEISIIGVPKTIDGDLSHKFLNLSFGFDTATKFYSSLIGNISRDVFSSKTSYHFIKLMGRSASHVALECALQTHPNIALIGEELAYKQVSLDILIKKIVKIIKQRASIGKFYGTVLIPEGVIEFIPEIIILVEDIEKNSPLSLDNFSTKLSLQSSKLLSILPQKIVHQLLFDRDVYGNVWLAKISVEEFFIDLIKKELERDNPHIPFNAISHSLGYEGRSSLPTKFDNNYCYALGFSVVGLIKNKLTGYLATIDNLHKPIDQWKSYGIPIAAMLELVKDKKNKTSFPLIQKHLVEMTSLPFLAFANYRKLWQMEDAYRFLGPMQWNVDETFSLENLPFCLMLKESSQYKTNQIYFNKYKNV